MRAPALRDVLRALPGAARPLVEQLITTAEARGTGLHLVGGPVRDLLLGRPLLDVDVLVEPGPSGGADALARAAAPEGARIVAHERFGTVRMEWQDGAVDLAEVRRESYAHPGALPVVEPGELVEDLARRDFTVNAMAVPLTRDARAAGGGLVDPEGGAADLEGRVLRVLHRVSFRDDPTRALRAARFSARLGFHLSRGSRGALRDALREGAFGSVSGDRLRRELEKLFEDARAGMDPALALRRLAEWHVLGALEPGLELPRTAVAPLRRLGRALVTPWWSYARFQPWAAGLAVWLAPLGPGLRRRALRRLAVRGDRASRLLEFPRQRDRWLRQLSGARGRGAVDRALQGSDEERLLALAVSAPVPVRRRVVRWAGEDRGRRALVGGAELVGLGLAGPDVGRALEAVRAAWLDGVVRTREDALALAREVAGRRRPGARPR